MLRKILATIWGWTTKEFHNNPIKTTVATIALIGLIYAGAATLVLSIARGWAATADTWKAVGSGFLRTGQWLRDTSLPVPLYAIGLVLVVASIAYVRAWRWHKRLRAEVEAFRVQALAEAEAKAEQYRTESVQSTKEALRQRLKAQIDQEVNSLSWNRPLTGPKAAEYPYRWLKAFDEP